MKYKDSRASKKNKDSVCYRLVNFLKRPSNGKIPTCKKLMGNFLNIVQAGCDCDHPRLIIHPVSKICMNTGSWSTNFSGSIQNVTARVPVQCGSVYDLFVFYWARSMVSEHCSFNSILVILSS